MEQDRPLIFGLHIDDDTKSNLRTMATWALIVAITMVIRYIINIIEYFNTRAELNRYAEEYGYEYSTSSSSSTLIWTLLGILIGLTVCYFLYRFSSLTKKGLDNNSQEDLDMAIFNLKNYFLTVAIILIVVIAVVVIALTFYSAGPI